MWVYNNPTHTRRTPQFCGGGIKRDTIYFQYIGFGAVPKHRSKRVTLILKQSV
jgi:hypothetical protein